MRFFLQKVKISLLLLAFFQAVSLVLYCGLIGVIFWQGNKWFGPPYGFWGPALMLTLLVASVLICGLLGLGFAFRLFWIEKKPEKALKLVVYTTLWLVFLAVLFFIILSILF